MKLQMLNKLCFTTCIVCIVSGAALSLIMIWGDIGESEFMWKALTSIGVLFFAAAATLGVSKAMGGASGRNGPE
jgi:hypothetical protein